MTQPTDTPRDARSPAAATRPEAVTDRASPFPLPVGTRVWVSGNNTAAKAEIERRLEEVIRPSAGPVDVALIAPVSEEEAQYFAEKIRPRVCPDGTIWLVRERGYASRLPQQDAKTKPHLVGDFEIVLFLRS